MASNVHSLATSSPSRASTAVLVADAEDQTPFPTLRLRSDKEDKKKKEKKKNDNESAEKLCEEAKRQILAKIKKALDDNVDKIRAFLKSQVPVKGSKTEEEYQQEVEKFKHALSIIKQLLGNYSDFNDELVQSVADYLVASWKMIAAGEDPETIKRFKEQERIKRCALYDQKAINIEGQIKQLL